MTTKFKDYINSVADGIIALSRQLDNEIETWRDVVARVPDSANKGVSAGFISKPNATSGIEIVADIQAPPTEQIARFRIWAIETVKDSDDNERFNNIQLTYLLDYGKARRLVEQADSLTRENLATLAHDHVEQLTSIVISNQTGLDVAAEQLLGKRYDIQSDKLSNLSEDFCDELELAMSTVLERLKQTATSVNLAQ
ncbi:MAG: hypothetical protein ABI354_03445 [Candidatus Saccharimonadales bacterium]